jgi:hypothetical protein
MNARYLGRFRDRAIFTVVVSAFVLSYGWAGWQLVTEIRQRGATSGLLGSDSMATYHPNAPVEPMTAKASWAPPGAEARGEKWIFELFTPPEIYFDPKSQNFFVSPPKPSAVAAPSEFGLELLSVRREPFRLQLVGFIGDNESASGTFENLVTSEHFLARSRRSVPDLEVTIQDFMVARQRVDASDPASPSERVAIATVRDERTNEVQTLTNRERAFVGEFVATVQFGGPNPMRYELHEGETVEHNEVSYRIEKLQADPPTAQVVKLLPDHLSTEARMLQPRQ